MSKLIDRIKYGKIILPEELEFFHVAGPVDDTGTAIGKKFDLTGLVDPSLIQPDGQIWDDSFDSQQDYVTFLRALGDAYLGGRIDFKNALPISSTVFMLPLDRDAISYTLRRVDRLENLSAEGEIKKYSGVVALQEARENQTSVEKAKQYVKDLLFWELNCNDYSDHVTIGIEERGKEVSNGLRRTLLISREWSKANKGMSGEWRVVKRDSERIAISGYDTEAGGEAK